MSRPLFSFYARLSHMPKPRGREHSSLTETAVLIVHELTKIPGVKMIAPGEIRPNAKKRGGSKFVTTTYTTGGFELLISGQAVQKVAVHTTSDPKLIIDQLKNSKQLRNITFSERERMPGI